MKRRFASPIYYYEISDKELVLKLAHRSHENGADPIFNAAFRLSLPAK